MNAEQKQQAKQLIADWTNVSKTSTPAVWFLNGDCMAGFLQELVDAHEQKPVAYATGYYAGCLSIATVDGRVLPAGTALYAAPPHQSEHHLEMVNTPAPSVPGVANTFKRRAEEIVAMAMNRDNYAETNRLSAALIMDIANAAAAPTPAEAPADVALDAARYRWLLDSNWYVGPDSFYCTGGGELEDYQNKNNSAESLDAAVDAAIAAKKGGAK